MENISRFLEITIISAEDLRLHNHSIKKNAFVIVRTDSHNQKSTSMDTQGGSYPTWNEKLDVALPNSARFISVEVQCQTGSGVRKVVGAANVPVSDFVGDYTPAYYLHLLSYRLRERDGERNGIVNLSIRMKIPEYIGRTLFPSGVQADNMISGSAIGIPVPYGTRF